MPFLILAQLPTANFTSSTISGCSPLTVTFSDLSSGSPFFWWWDFGNSNNSIYQNPSAVYTIPGTYTVTLSVSNASGSDTIEIVNYITVFQDPNSNFTADTTAGCNPLACQFLDLSTPGASPISSWFWDFGDGNYSTIQNPSHLYTLAAVNSISLTTTDSIGCSNVYAHNNYIKVSDAAQVDFSSGNTNTCQIPFTVSFMDMSIAGSDPIDTWSWDFGDSTSPDSFQNPSHTYGSYGLYDVTLTVSDSNSCSSSYLVTDYVKIEEFIADFDIDTVTSCPDISLFFTDMSSPSPFFWNWDFGNGSNSNSQNPSTTYFTTDSFKITLNSYSSYGCSDTVQKQFINLPLIVQFTPDTLDNCELPLPVNFTNNSSGTPPMTYVWDYDDNSLLDTSLSPSHTFNLPGTYDVSLVGIDDFGCSDTMKLTDVGNPILISEPFSHYTYTPMG
ncbi:MAG: PKD domain-containing protein, partial [Flavobacteriales bacterium]|nr:PKD domain-containing protein [Flavobacteriales bacterium]